MGIYACPRCGNPNGWWSGNMRDIHDCPGPPRRKWPDRPEYPPQLDWSEVDGNDAAISPPTPSPQTCTHAPARSHLCEHDCAEGAVGGPRCEGPCAVLGLHPMDEVAHGVGEVQPQQFWCDKQGHGGRRCRRFCGLDICEPSPQVQGDGGKGSEGEQHVRS